MISFACAAYALKFMQAGILYVLWSGIGVIATALLAKAFLGQNIDLAGWLGIGFITVGLTIIAQFSNIDVKKEDAFILLVIGNSPSTSLQIDR